MAHLKTIIIFVAVALAATIDGNSIPQSTNSDVVDQNEPAQDLASSEAEQESQNRNVLDMVHREIAARPDVMRSPPYTKFSLCSIKRDYTSFEEIGSCYKVHDRSLTFLEAIMKCRVEGAELAIINSEAEANVLKMLKGNDPNTKNINMYIGALKVLENWITLQGQTLSKAGYSSWAFTEPNNDGGHENCAEIEANGKLNDVPCDTLRPYICELKI